MTATTSPTAPAQPAAVQPSADLWDVVTHLMWVQPEHWQSLLAGLFALSAGILAAGVGIAGLLGVRYQARRADARADKDRRSARLMVERARAEEQLAALTLVLAVCDDQSKISKGIGEAAQRCLGKSDPLQAFREEVRIDVADRFLDYWEKSRPAILDIKTGIGTKIAFLVGKDIVSLLPELFAANYDRDVVVHTIIKGTAQDDQELKKLIETADRVVEVSKLITDKVKAERLRLSNRIDDIDRETGGTNSAAPGHSLRHA